MCVVPLYDQAEKIIIGLQGVHDRTADPGGKQSIIDPETRKTKGIFMKKGIKYRIDEYRDENENIKIH